MSKSESPYLPAQVLAEHTQVQIPSLPEWIGPTVEFLCQKAVLCGACSSTRSGKLMVALHEALANSIIHGNLEISSALKEQGDDAFAQALAERAADERLAQRCVDIAMDYDGASCRWRITDEGKGFDVPQVLARCLSDDPEVLLASGRGILMMRSFLDEVRYEQGGKQVLLQMRKESGLERRGKVRLPLHQPIKITPVHPDGSSGQEMDAMLRNLSEGGAALLQDQLATSEKILIGLWSHGKWIHLPAQVRHVQSRGGNVVEMGCQFLNEDSGAAPTTAVSGQDVARLHLALDTLLAKHRSDMLPTDERRAHPRIAYTRTIQVVAKPGEPPITAHARDLSRGGMSFIATAPVDMEITIVLLPQDGGAPLQVRSRVLRCHQVQRGFFDVGVHFLHLANA